MNYSSNHIVDLPFSPSPSPGSRPTLRFCPISRPTHLCTRRFTTSHCSSFVHIPYLSRSPYPVHLYPLYPSVKPLVPLSCLLLFLIVCPLGRRRPCLFCALTVTPLGPSLRRSVTLYKSMYLGQRDVSLDPI